MSNAIALCWSGFLQSERISNGERDLERKLLEFMPAERVLRSKWNDKHRPALTVANMVRKLWEADEQLQVIATGHSKGGDAANDCCWYLFGFDVPVKALILCDAFGDHLGRDSLLVPANVRNVEVFRSTENWIEGSPVELQDAKATRMYEHPPQSTPHYLMDEAEDYHAAVIAAVQGDHDARRPNRRP